VGQCQIWSHVSGAALHAGHNQEAWYRSGRLLVWRVFMNGSSSDSSLSANALIDDCSKEVSDL
jgi:hypothetical protein